MSLVKLPYSFITTASEMFFFFFKVLLELKVKVEGKTSDDEGF